MVETFWTRDHVHRRIIVLALAFSIFHFPFSISGFLPASAQTLNQGETVDITDKGFRLVVCDGPKLPPGVQAPKEGYVPCDFRAIMKQVRVLVNVAMVAGVVVAVLGFVYGGYLMMTGSQKNIEHAKKIFLNVFVGFIIMLSAWFIVYQILTWLTGDSGFSSLLGKP